MVGWLGLVLYAVYADCDPLTAKTVRKQVDSRKSLSMISIKPFLQDQLVPFMVLDVAGAIPGLPGLFMAGVFSGSLRFLKSYFEFTSRTTTQHDQQRTERVGSGRSEGLRQSQDEAEPWSAEFPASPIPYFSLISFDFISTKIHQIPGEHKQALLTKVFSVVFGVLCYSGTFVIR